MDKNKVQAALDEMGIESPIEAQFLFAILDAAKRRSIRLLPPNEDLPEFNDPPDDVAFLFMQQKIGPYRCDFMLGRPSKYLVIECDGFDYHSSKDSLAHDKRRDRFIQKHVPIIRFTGSEIHKAAMDCANEALDCFETAPPIGKHTIEAIEGGDI